MTYQCQHLTISSSISECDHKCETRNTEPEIGPDGSSQTRRNPRVDGYGSGFGPPRVSGSGFWPGLEPNRPVCAVQTRTAGRLPGPVANTNLASPCITRGGSVAHIDYLPGIPLMVFSGTDEDHNSLRMIVVPDSTGNSS